jgi:phosphoenolpyruvate-protein kinase (PTS system EI component)
MTAPDIHMPSSFMEQCSSLSAASKSKAPSSLPEDDTTMNRMHQYLIVRLQQQRQEQRARFLQMPTQLLSSQSSLLGDSSLQTKKQSNVDGALHSNEAAANKTIFNRPSAVKAINTDAIEQEQQEAAPCRTIGKTICVPCRARGMPKDHVFKVRYHAHVGY